MPLDVKPLRLTAPLVVAFAFSACVAVSAAIASAPDEPHSAPPADVKVGLDLLKRGDAAAGDGKSTDAEILYQEGMESLLPGIRQLPFKTRVKRDVTARDKIRDYLIKSFEEDYAPGELRAEELALKAFGLLPRDLDYKETMLKVYSQEIGAFYDPRTDTMHLILETGDGRKPGLLESLMGRKQGFNKDESKVTIAHELTHALADQHYDLDKLMSANKDNDDAKLALAGLIEGEATLVMMGASAEDWTGEVTAMLPANTLGQTFGLMMPFMSMLSGPALRSAPPIIGESMLFPYLRGLVFCAHQTNKRGWKSIDEAYANPPRSTEQILHPEKFFDELDEPTVVDLGSLTPGGDWKELRRNVMGELQISVLLRPYNGRDASAGWDGDQYAVFESPGERLALAWFTTWDSEKDAREFARSMARYQKARFGGDDPPADIQLRRIDLENDNQSVSYLIERIGNDVIVLEGFEPATTDALLPIVREATKREYATR